MRVTKLRMDSTSESTQTDAALLAFLQSHEGKESEEFLARLVSEQTKSTISPVVRGKLRVSLSPNDGAHQNQEALDLVMDVQAAIVAKLRDLRSNSSHPAISSLSNYVATVSFNACNLYWRQKYPKRWSLKNKLRYLLTHADQFKLWQRDDREWVAGFAQWEGTPTAPATQSQLEQFHERAKRFPHIVAKLDRSSLTDLLKSVFQYLDCPILLDDLVSLAVTAFHVVEDRINQDTDGNLVRHQDAIVSPTILSELEERERLKHLWSEICGLPLRHRTALLLNLRNRIGADSLAIFSATGIASIRQIARVLEFADERFAVIWNELPWDDLRIADHLGLTRQQVINLRQSSRNRLLRRLREK